MTRQLRGVQFQEKGSEERTRVRRGEWNALKQVTSVSSLTYTLRSGYEYIVEFPYRYIVSNTDEGEAERPLYIYTADATESLA